MITTAGFNDSGWLDSGGHPQTESLRMTERLRRRDFDHMDFEMTMQGLNEPRLPLYVQSETNFMSTATPTGFEFVKGAQGRVTGVIVRGNAGEEKAVRRSDASSPRR